MFYLRCSCGLYEEALSECVELLDEWYPTHSILALIAECVSYFPSYDSVINEIIFPEYKKLWNTLKKDLLYRTQKIQEYSYLPPLICMYHFIV